MNIFFVIGLEFESEKQNIPNGPALKTKPNMFSIEWSI